MRYAFFHNSILLFILLSTPLHAEDKQAAPSQTTLAKRAIQFTPAEFKWVDAPRSMPTGAKIQVLEGNPTRAGLFTMRVKLPAQTTLMPHSHPHDERVTVLSGSAYVGLGSKVDLAKAKPFTAGSYYVNPAKLHHYVYFGEETVIQLTGTGPWEIHYLKAPVAPGILPPATLMLPCTSETPKKKKRAK